MAKELDLNTELLLGTMAHNAFLTFMGRYFRGLPQYIDDAQRDFGLDIYERMMKDPAVVSSIGALRTLTLSQGPRFLSRVQAPSPTKPDPEQQAEYDRAEELRQFVEAMMDHLQEPLEEVLEQMLDFLPYGHTVAEETYEERGGRLVLKTLRPKPRSAFAFVVDEYMNLIGLVGAKRGSPMLSSSMASTVSPDDVIPREKFFIISNGATYGDPRGSSVLRPAYNSWYLKQQAWPMYLKFLAQFGTPSICGTLPPDAGDVEVVDAQGQVTLDDDGNPVAMSAAEAMLAKLVAFANGTAVVLEHGSDLNILEPKGDGEAYVKAFDLFDRQITRAVLVATRATMEAEHGSKADSSTAQDILSEITQGIRRKVEVAFFRDVLQPIIRYNFGDEAADGLLCPYMSLSDVAREDVVAVGNMIANLARSEMLHPSQYPGLDVKLGLPERDFEAQMAEMTERREIEAEERLELERVLNPARGSDDGTA